MKKTFAFLTVVMIISSVVFARPNDDPGSASGVAVIKNGKTFKLYYKNAELSNVKISIRDASDKVVFTETLRNTTGFVRPYNFSTLEQGNYTMEISDKSGIHTESITIEREPRTNKTARLFKVPGEDGKFMLTVANRSSNDITVRIFDSSNAMIYSGAESIEENFAKVYNLQQYSGKFTFEITDGKGNTETVSN